MPQQRSEGDQESASLLKQETILNDLRSSLVVFLVALPLCMGIALASAVPVSRAVTTHLVQSFCRCCVGPVTVPFSSGALLVF